MVTRSKSLEVEQLPAFELKQRMTEKNRTVAILHLILFSLSFIGIQLRRCATKQIKRNDEGLIVTAL